MGLGRRRRILLIDRTVGDLSLPRREQRRTLINPVGASEAPPLLRRRRCPQPFVNRIGGVDPKGPAHRIEAFVLEFPLVEDEERVFLVLVLLILLLVVVCLVVVVVVVKTDVLVFVLEIRIGIEEGGGVIVFIILWSRIRRRKSRRQRRRVEVAVLDGEGRKSGDGERAGEGDDRLIERVGCVSTRRDG